MILQVTAFSIIYSIQQENDSNTQPDLAIFQ